MGLSPNLRSAHCWKVGAVCTRIWDSYCVVSDVVYLFICPCCWNTVLYMVNHLNLLNLHTHQIINTDFGTNHSQRGVDSTPCKCLRTYNSWLCYIGSTHLHWIYIEVVIANIVCIISLKNLCTKKYIWVHHCRATEERNSAFVQLHRNNLSNRESACECNAVKCGAAHKYPPTPIAWGRLLQINSQSVRTTTGLCYIEKVWVCGCGCFLSLKI